MQRRRPVHRVRRLGDAGRTEIADVHQALFDRWLKGTTLVAERTEVRFVAEGVAVVVSSGGTLMRGKREPSPERDSIQTLVSEVSGYGQSIKKLQLPEGFTATTSSL